MQFFHVILSITYLYIYAYPRIYLDVMAESRLTFTQRSGLQSILRKGDALPTRPGDIYRQELCRYRHAERAARSLQVPLLPPNFNKMDRTKLPHNVQLMCKVCAYTTTYIICLAPI